MIEATSSSFVATVSAYPTQPIYINIPESKTDWIPILITGLFTMSSALGVVFINEYFKKKDRETLYSEELFKKKLDLYEQLFNKMRHAYEVAIQILEDEKLNSEERNKIWSEIVFAIANFIEKNEIYLNENVTLHCLFSLIGVDDIPEMTKKTKEKALKKFYQARKDTIDLIKEESGLKRLDRVLKAVNKPSLKSEYIDYMEKFRKKQER